MKKLGLGAETRKVTVNCPKHGPQETTQVQKPDGEWVEAVCPLCAMEHIYGQKVYRHAEV